MECHFFCFLIILHLCSDPILGQSINEKWINGQWTGTHAHGIQCTKCIIGAKAREYICSGCAKDNANKPFTCRRCKDETSAEPFICRRCTNSNPDINSRDCSDSGISSCDCDGLKTTTAAVKPFDFGAPFGSINFGVNMEGMHSQRSTLAQTANICIKTGPSISQCWESCGDVPQDVRPKIPTCEFWV